MTYNWPKIVEKKTDSELYDILTDGALLPEEAINAAKKEVQNRGYQLDNLKQLKKFIELNSLIDEQDDEVKFFGRMFNPPSKEILKRFYVSIFGTILFALNLIFNFLHIDKMDSIFYFAFSLFFIVFNYYSYKNKIKRDKFVRERIAKLEDEI